MPSIRSSRVVTPEGERPATIQFTDGIITEVGGGRADVDYGELVVLPGLVDSHVHVNEPGRTDWEGFATATRAAVTGGTTTIVDMPLNSIPPTIDRSALAAKRQAAASQLSCDVAFWGGLVPGSEAEIAGLVADGVCGFKMFTVDSGVPEFPPVSPEEFESVGKRVAAADVPLLVHAEEPGLLENPEPGGDPRRYATYLATRPPEAEASAIRRIAGAVPPETVHVLHVASRQAVEAIAENGVSAETCPHYLTFEAAAIPDGATEFKCAPPIREREHREVLWEALGQGILKMIVSDHSPAPPERKKMASGDFLAAWGGIASLELRLAAVWTEARQRGRSLTEVARWLSTAPAVLAGLDHRKGSIAPGHDADFVVFDPEGVTMVSAARLEQRHPVTPYDGRSLSGEVVATWLRGRAVHGAGASAAVGRMLSRGE